MAKITARCRELFGGEPLIFPHGPDPLSTACVLLLGEVGSLQ